MKERLDKYLSNLWIASRKEIKKLIKKWIIKIQVNNNDIFDPEFKITEWDIINFNGKIIPVKRDIIILLHKPSWYVSSDVDDGHHPSYKKLLEDCPYKNLVKVAWRLDVDTEWLLVLMSDGKKIHQITSPKKWKEKVYIAHIEKNLSKEDIEKLEKPMEIDNYTTLWSKIKILWDKKIQITITEGKFHQIKKMLNAVNNKVLYLKRISVWNYKLWDLKKWEWKYFK